MSLEERIEKLIEAISDNTIELQKLNSKPEQGMYTTTITTTDLDEEQPPEDEGEDDDAISPKKKTAVKKKAASKKASKKKASNSKADPEQLKNFHTTTKELLQTFTKKLTEKNASVTHAMAKTEVIDFMEEETGVRRLDAITFAQFPSFIEALQEEVND